MPQGVKDYLTMETDRDWARVRVRYDQQYDIGNNQSTISIVAIEAQTTSPHGYYGYTWNLDGTISIDGQTAATISTQSGQGSIYIGSQDTWTKVSNYTSTPVTVNHNDDGTKSIQIGFHKLRWSNFIFQNNSGSGYQFKITNGTTANVTLTRIPMTSGISVRGTFTMGESGTISIDKAHENFTHTVRYYCGGYQGTVVSKTSYSSVSWTPPLYLANSIPSSTEIAGTLYLDTYSGYTKVGTSSCTFKAKIPSTMKPSITEFTPSRVDNEVPPGWEIYLQNFSQCKLTVKAAGAYGSSIQSYSIKLGDQVISSESTGTSAVLQTSGKVVFTASVTDSRQRTATQTCQISVEPYYLPSINPVESQRCLSDGTPNDDGTYILCSGEFDVASCAGHNSGQRCRVYYRQSGTQSWLGGYDFQSGVSIVINANANVDNSYECMYEITDFFNTAQVIDVVGTGFTTMDFKKGGRGIGIGKVAETDNLLDIDIKTKIRKPLILVDDRGREYDVLAILKRFV